MKDGVPYTEYENHPHLLKISTHLHAGDTHPHYSWDEFELHVAADLLAERGCEVTAQLLRDAHMVRVPEFSEGWGSSSRMSKWHYFTREERRYANGGTYWVWKSHCHFQRTTIYGSQVAVYPREFLPDGAKANLCIRCLRVCERGDT